MTETDDGYRQYLATEVVSANSFLRAKPLWPWSISSHDEMWRIIWIFVVALTIIGDKATKK